MCYVSPPAKKEDEQRTAKANASLLQGCIGFFVVLAVVFALICYSFNFWIEKNAREHPVSVPVQPSLSPEELKKAQANNTWIDHNGKKHEEIDFRSRWANQLADNSLKEDVINANNNRKDFPKDAPIRKQELGMTNEQKFYYERQKRDENPDQYIRDTGILHN